MEKVFHSTVNAGDNEPLTASGSTSKAIRFSHLILYVIAACLMTLGLSETWQVFNLKSQLLAAKTDAARLRESNALRGLHLATLEAKDASYASSKILIAWEPYQHLGSVALQNLPSPPTGHDYQLWVLDPNAETPISAGVITSSRSFSVEAVSTPSPGFAISLEPSGGSSVLTGPILFAVAPGP